MALSKIVGGSIRSIVNIIPKDTYDNLQENLIPEVERESMVSHTGIRFRRKFDISKTDTHRLFAEGISNTLNSLNWAPETISALVCVTQTPPTRIPAVSCLLHHEFNFAPSAACLDINLGCSGYVYGLHQCFSLLQNQLQGSGRALLCCGDISSLLVQNDKTTTPIFSDAISVTALEFDNLHKENPLVSYFNLETLGSGHTAIRSDFDENNREVMRLNGIEVFNYSVQFVPRHIKSLLSEIEGLEIPVVVLHQANKLINDAIAKRIPLPDAAFPSTLYQYGNTASASIPITLVDYLSTLSPKQFPKHALLSGFGVGFSMGSAVVPISSDLNINTLSLSTSVNS